MSVYEEHFKRFQIYPDESGRGLNIIFTCMRALARLQ